VGCWRFTDPVQRSHPHPGPPRKGEGIQSLILHTIPDRLDAVRDDASAHKPSTVIPGLVLGIHALTRPKTWMAGTSPAMTIVLKTQSKMRIMYASPLAIRRAYIILNAMHSDRHHHHHPVRAVAAAPTFSLLRLSAWERMAGAGVVLGVLWCLVLLVLA
jgi:hypothetical protein